MLKFLKNVRNRITNPSTCIHLKANGNSKGDILLSSGTEIYKRLNSGQGFHPRHSAAWENYQMSKTFLDLGFNVDVIDFNNMRFIPKKDYVVCIDFLSNLERLSKYLSSECIKIYHPHWMHWTAHNSAIYQRLYNLQSRKGVSLKPRKLLAPNLSIEQADYVTQMGHRVTAATYDYACKKSYHVRHSSNFQYDFPVQKDFNKCRKNFLWLGGYGLVAKGLDLVLEAFSDMPEYQLTLCGPIRNCGTIKKEEDFEEVYRKELYNTPNIQTVGFIDVGSDEFIELANNCVGLIYPSCAELSCGSTITCMHAGLIPLVSQEADIDIDDIGVVLKDCAIDTIKEAVINVSQLPESQLQEKSRQAWEYARSVHTRENYVKDYRDAITQIIA